MFNCPSSSIEICQDSPLHTADALFYFFAPAPQNKRISSVINFLFEQKEYTLARSGLPWEAVWHNIRFWYCHHIQMMNEMLSLVKAWWQNYCFHLWCPLSPPISNPDPRPCLVRNGALPASNWRWSDIHGWGGEGEAVGCDVYAMLKWQLNDMSCSSLSVFWLILEQLCDFVFFRTEKMKSGSILQRCVLICGPL